MDKSPISVLQEYAVAKGIALPHYHIVSEGENFKCIVTIGNVTQDAKAANKKRAKHIAAEKVVSLLINEGTIGSTNITNDLSTVITNSVGELNEFSSRTGIEYPVYDFHSNVLFGNNEFICKCKLDCYETEGTGKSKKEAKQVAAKRMVDIANSSENSWKTRTRLSLSPNTTSDSVPKDSETIIEIFKKLSFRNNAPLNGCTQVVLPKKILTEAEIDRLFEEANDEPSLKNLLANLGMTCTILEFQTNPLVMCIKTESSDYAPFTFLQNGINRSEIMVKLLRNVVDAIAVHM